MLNRYLLFVWKSGAQKGGWGDFAADVKSVDAANEWIKKSDRDFDRAHLVDAKTGTIVEGWAYVPYSLTVEHSMGDC